MEYYSSIKRNKLLMQATSWMNQKHYIEHKKPNTKEYILYDSINMKLKNRQN